VSESRAAGASRWILALAVVLVVAKAALLALRVADGAAVAPSGWLPIALLHEDVRVVAAFALLVALAWRVARLRAVVPVVYAALAFWTAFNVPVARQLSSPLTFAFLHATGGAISDSIASYLTPANLGVPLAVCALAFALPRLLRAPGRGVAIVLTTTAVFTLALGPTAVRRAGVSGWHRTAVVTIAETTFARHAGRAPAPPPPLTSDACRPLVDPGAADLSDLVGLAQTRNVVWVILESTGARAFPAYGAARDVTPNLSALAAGAVVFDNAYAAYPESIKGFFSMICGREPLPGAEASDFVRDRVPCAPAAEAFARAGIRTGLFHSGWFAYLGMEAVVRQRGFDVLVDAGAIDSPHRSSFGVDDRATARSLLAFVDQTPRDQRFFAVFMPIAGHHPYRAPGAAPRPFPEHDDHSAYFNDLHVADDSFGLLREGLRARGLDDQTVYVVVGDHGEAFREHPGNIAHALHVYEENVRVPFFIAAPGANVRPRRAPQLASLIDLTPTTLSLAGLPTSAAHEGRSLLTPSAPRVARFSTEQGVRRVALRDGRWKVIVDADSGRAEVYDLIWDPSEQRPVTAPADVVARYRGCLGL
jgi:arylsulfatase A-like enzyme